MLVHFDNTLYVWTLKYMQKILPLVEPSQPVQPSGVVLLLRQASTIPQETQHIIRRMQALTSDIIILTSMCGTFFTPSQMLQTWFPEHMFVRLLISCFLDRICALDKCPKVVGRQPLRS